MHNAITVHNNPMPLVEFQGQCLTLQMSADFTQAVNLSKLDMRSRFAGGPTARERGEDYGPALWCCLDQNQPYGSDLFFNCRASCWAMSTSSRSCTPACVPISPIRSSASRAPLRLDNSFSSPLSLSWRRIISPCMAETINPAEDSPLRFNNSMSDTTSWGTLTVKSCDFAFLFAEAIGVTPLFMCVSVYAKMKHKKALTCVSHEIKVKHILSTGKTQQSYKAAKPGSASTLTGPLTTTVNASNEAAMKNHTTAPQRFTFLFLAVVRANPQAHPHREQITAVSEREARSLLAGRYVLVFAGRLPTLEVTHG